MKIILNLITYCLVLSYHLQITVKANDFGYLLSANADVVGM